MNLDNRVKNRRLKRNILNLLNLIKFKGVNLDNWWKIVFFWWIIVFVSLFFNWIESVNNDLFEGGNAFSWLIGLSWIIILFSIFYLFFNLFSISKKEKLKQYSNIYLSNYKISLIVWTITILLSLNSLFSISSLSIFTTDVIYWKWIILSITWWIILIAWWIIQKKFWSKTSSKIFLNNDSLMLNDKDEEKDEDNKSNMKLPF